MRRPDQTGMTDVLCLRAQHPKNRIAPQEASRSRPRLLSVDQQIRSSILFSMIRQSLRARCKPRIYFIGGANSCSACVRCLALVGLLKQGMCHEARRRSKERGYWNQMRCLLGQVMEESNFENCCQWSLQERQPRCLGGGGDHVVVRE